MLRKFAVGIAATSLLATSAFAQSVDRQPAQVNESEEIEGAQLPVILAIVAVITGAIIVLADDDDDLPTSP